MTTVTSLALTNFLSFHNASHQRQGAAKRSGAVDCPLDVIVSHYP